MFGLANLQTIHAHHFLILIFFNMFFRQLGCPTCILCPAGNYSDSIASTECPPCEPGSFSNVSGSKFCTGCEVGYFSHKAGSVTCTACPIGSHQPEKNQTSCLPCEAGHETRLGNFSSLALKNNTFHRKFDRKSGRCTCIQSPFPLTWTEAV